MPAVNEDVFESPVMMALPAVLVPEIVTSG
jgi:hypothetical protein